MSTEGVRRAAEVLAETLWDITHDRLVAGLADDLPDALLACAPDSAAGVALLRDGSVIPYEQPRLTEAERAEVDDLRHWIVYGGRNITQPRAKEWLVIIDRLVSPGIDEEPGDG